MVTEKKKGKGRVRTVVDFGCLDGCTVCRIRTVNADRDDKVKRLNAETSVRGLLERALHIRITDRPFVKMFSFWIEPRNVHGGVGNESGTMWTDFRVYPSCINMVRKTAVEIYDAIIHACEKKYAAQEGGAK